MRNFKALLLTSVAALMAANPAIAQTPQPANPAKPVAATPTGQDQSAPAIQLTAQQFQQFLQAIGNIGKAQQAPSPATLVPPAQSSPAANAPMNVAATAPVTPPVTPTPVAAVNNPPPAAPVSGAKSAASSGNGGGTLTVTSTSSGEALTIGGTAVQPANVSNSADNYYDDGLKWSVDIQGWSDPYTKPTADLCIPANTRMLGRSTSPVTTATVSSSVVDNAKANATKSTTGAGTATASAASNKYVEVQLNPTPFLYLFPPHIEGQPAVAATQPCQGGQNGKATAIGQGQTFYVSYGDLQNVDYRSGWDYGALVIPFKAQMSSKKAISGSASLGGYLGYRMPFQNIGFTVSPIIFAGISTISTSVASSSSGTPATGSSSNTSSQTLAALTYGGGLVWQIKNSSFQVGMLLGFDHVDSLQPYTYNDKPWLSIEVGYSFAQ